MTRKEMLAEATCPACGHAEKPFGRIWTRVVYVCHACGSGWGSDRDAQVLAEVA